jgi:hypothetical protein
VSACRHRCRPDFPAHLPKGYRQRRRANLLLALARLRGGGPRRGRLRRHVDSRPCIPSQARSAVPRDSRRVLGAAQQSDLVTSPDRSSALGAPASVSVTATRRPFRTTSDCQRRRRQALLLCANSSTEAPARREDGRRRRDGKRSPISFQRGPVSSCFTHIGPGPPRVHQRENTRRHPATRSRAEPIVCRDFSTARAHTHPRFTRRCTTHNREVPGSNPGGAIALPERNAVSRVRRKLSSRSPLCRAPEQIEDDDGHGHAH